MGSEPTSLRLEARHSASFVTFQKPCEEALRDISEAYNRLADQWEEMHAALTDIAAMPGPGKSGTGAAGWLTTHELAPKRAQEALDAIT